MMSIHLEVVVAYFGLRGSMDCDCVQRAAAGPDINAVDLRGTQHQ